jgi:hypothetical protein
VHGNRRTPDPKKKEKKKDGTKVICICRPPSTKFLPLLGSEIVRWNPRVGTERMFKPIVFLHFISGGPHLELSEEASSQSRQFWSRIIREGFVQLAACHNGKPQDKIHPFHPVCDSWFSADPSTIHDDFGCALETLGRWPNEARHDSPVPDQEGTVPARTLLARMLSC